MIEDIKLWIKNIVMVIILVSFLDILIPDGKIKKYLNLILGFIVMIIILSPIIDFLNSNENLENEVFKISSKLDKKEYSFINSNIENKQVEQLSSLYKNRIKEDIVYRVESKYDVKVTKVNIELENSKDGKFGEIKSLELSLADRNTKLNENAIPIVKIDVINNEQNTGTNNNSNEDNNIDTDLRKKIKEDISNIYNLNEIKVVVNY
ncbi:stage III sporulation protein AF [Paramaledivibacter caminithermalis]|jgi:stage III sporulation protein AF|uniref:Stage III sporulation protein AF n=1 Tax=Paramaledivibacter caminithermalis (strain DSM 15212 / CIP 107654 / DViRD3) TaxID=1121301 RepID=A0A1M6JQY2_PARC5|nr:stage III sporulation protein AF [Paramaledivibacter caminithermalis]SHJ49094.1 stage III sporulation protein AF [Paramaledivibacter caminithermalis DSM 15212]